MCNKETFSKYKIWCFIAVFLILGSVANSSAEEIQPFPQLKEFPKLPQIPNIELKSIQEPIKPLKLLNSEVDRSKLASEPLQSFDKSQLVGDWKASQPFVAKYIGGVTRIEGVLFTVMPDSSLDKEWTSEGVIYESTTNEGARRFASSFNYKTLSNLLLMMITFSSNDLKNGVVILFEVLAVTKISDGTRILKLKNNDTFIELIGENSTGK